MYALHHAANFDFVRLQPGIEDLYHAAMAARSAARVATVKCLWQKDQTQETLMFSFSGEHRTYLALFGRFSFAVLFVLLLATAAWSQHTCPSNLDENTCETRCGIVVVRMPDGTIEAAEDPRCLAKCATCRRRPQDCSANFSCMERCGVEVDPQTRQARVSAACLAQCPSCQF